MVEISSRVRRREAVRLIGNQKLPFSVYLYKICCIQPFRFSKRQGLSLSLKFEHIPIKILIWPTKQRNQGVQRVLFVHENRFPQITLDTPFKQQRMTAWQPILTPIKVIAIFIVIGIIFVPVGVSLLESSKEVLILIFDTPFPHLR
jgi:hypothetical protein